MSYLQVIPSDGKTDEQRYDEFLEYMFKEGVIEKALEADYDGEYAGVIQEKIAADMSPMGLVYDPEDKGLLVERHRAMTIRVGIDDEVRSLCKSLDNQIKYELSEEDLKAIKELELADDEVEDEIFLRPFCLYQVDLKHVYKKDLSALPENPAEFAKLALEHEMDCNYEDSDDDGDWEDDEEEDDDDDEDDEDDDEEEEEENATDSKGKGKAAAAANDDDEDEEEHVHGENCNHDHDVVDLNNELPFDESEVTVNAADDGLKLLKEHKDKIAEMLEKVTGCKIDEFKTYHIPGRHYVVAWLKGFGIYGVRISYPMLINDTDDEFEDEDDEEAGGSGSD
ncbi:hypothetical protein GGI25_006376 [Coemansia spiralis]|uniref:Uncharacterized protein n=2 Tax=Coemansia TaxID=4863 RepID=A0A9W8G2P1_9FUNG|nr:hypothetical protein EDC05_006364 [Coemansia umbellata]KAJ2618681.1 hypothetical protein GGI26_006424 [Coemansia sp. RSA 1358]KAJ2668714.1 hypothetical protein GGI25_006376 [Coemansia spiralis]